MLFFVKVFRIAWFRCFRVREMYTQRKTWSDYFSLIELRSSLRNWLQTVPAPIQWSLALAFHPMSQREGRFLFSIVNFHQKEVLNCKYESCSSYLLAKGAISTSYFFMDFLLAFGVCCFCFYYFHLFFESFYDCAVFLDRGFFATAIGIRTLTRIPSYCIPKSTF